MTPESPERSCPQDDSWEVESVRDEQGNLVVGGKDAACPTCGEPGTAKHTEAVIIRGS